MSIEMHDTLENEEYQTNEKKELTPEAIITDTQHDLASLEPSIIEETPDSEALLASEFENSINNARENDEPYA